VLSDLIEVSDLSPRPLFDLSGSRVAVTGGLGLIGSAVAQSMIHAGTRLVVLDQAIDRWAPFVDGLPQNERAQAKFIPANMGEPVLAAEAVTTAAQALGGLDVWIGCAYPRTPRWGQRPELDEPSFWQSNVTMQLTATCVAATEAAKLMAQSGGGSIINVASIYGVVGPDFSIYGDEPGVCAAPYAAIKGGLINHTRYLASYFGRRGVRANVICPGGVFDRQDPQFVERYCGRTPLGRMAEPADLVGAFHFLASKAASYITGATIMVDGGWTAT
jgi:NAD(P)-dependent dehydrogenase (short-subunit alcohol dehydrogenase family)